MFPRRNLVPLLALCVASMALALPATAAASRSQFMIFEAPRELSSGDAALRSQTLDEIQSLGVNHIRVLLYWNNVAPQNEAKRMPKADLSDPNAGYDWGAYDAVINEASARGVRVLVTLTGPVPRWATGRRSGHTYKPSAAQFQRFVTAAGRRYGAAVSSWAIWNEPNHPQFLGPQFVTGRAYSPGLYRKLYKAGLRGLKASGNGGDRVLAGETAPRGTPRVVSPITFARGFFRGPKLRVDGYAHHPYTTRSGPFFVPPDSDDVTIGALSRLTRALDRYSHHRKLGVYLTEFGIQSKPDPFVGVSERQQAEYRSIAERLAYRNSRVRAFSQYMMRDDAPRAGSSHVRYSGFESGLRTSSGRAKPAYDGFRLPLAADRRGKSVSLWGLVRPANGATTIGLEYRNPGGKWRAYKPRSTDRRGYFTANVSYRKSRVYRLHWGGFAGPPTRPY
jgi:hypothetical protein